MGLLVRAIVFAVLLVGCTDKQSTVVTIPLETDTFISSRDSGDHSELAYTQVYKNSDGEDRVLFKFPTASNSEEDNLNDCFNNAACAVFFLPLAIIKSILSAGTCSNLLASDITQALLRLNTTSNAAFSAGQLDIFLLTKPYWQAANWTRAHPFSDKGKWDTEGGDYDSTSAQFNFPTNQTTCTGCTTTYTGDIIFDVTNYFKQVVNAPNSTHYGGIIVPTGNVAETKIISVQDGGAAAPRIEAQVSCTGSLNAQSKTYYLGQPVTEQSR